MSVDSIQADRQVLSVDARDHEGKREGWREREREREEEEEEERGRGMSIYVPNDASWGVREEKRTNLAEGMHHGGLHRSCHGA